MIKINLSDKFGSYIRKVRIQNNIGYLSLNDDYNEELSLITDTIIVDGNIRDINFYD